MNWFLIALIGPILWSIVTHLDKYQLEKKFKSGGVGTLMLFSSLIGLFILPIIYIVHPDVLKISSLNIFIMIFVGVLSSLALLLYFLALKKDEASVVVPFYQLVPVFGYFIGYLILGESLNQSQLIAMLLIILGASIISFEIDEDNNFKLRKRTISLMLVSSFLFSLNSVLFKFVAIRENFWITTFWEYVGLGTVGVLFFLFHKKYKKEFLSTFKNKFNIISLNIFNEILTIVGNVCTSYAYLFAPVVLVLLVNSYQPIFVFAIGIIITLFFPKFVAEKIKLKHMLPKVIAIIIMGLGTFILFK